MSRALKGTDYINERHKRLMSMMERKQKLMAEILDSGGIGFAGEEAGVGGAPEGKEKYRSGGMERYSCCRGWGHSEDSSWASKL